MLKLTVTLSESFNEETNRFIKEDFVLELEHSLVSLSKWESEFEVPFLDDKEKTEEQILAYVRCMILTEDYPEIVFDCFTQANVDALNAYIDKKMTATWFSDPKKPSGPSREKITSELIYYWMVSYQIPWEAQYWHINRLFTLIKVFNAKNEKKTPRSKAEIAAERQKINAERQRKYATSG